MNSNIYTPRAKKFSYSFMQTNNFVHHVRNVSESSTNIDSIIRSNQDNVGSLNFYKTNNVSNQKHLNSKSNVGLPSILKIESNKRLVYKKPEQFTPNLVLSNRLNDIILLQNITYKQIQKKIKNIFPKSTLIMNASDFETQSEFQHYLPRFLTVPYCREPYNTIRKSELDEMYIELREKISKLYHNLSKDFNIFLSNGDKIYGIQDIPIDEYLLVVTDKRYFNGIGFYKNKKFFNAITEQIELLRQKQNCQKYQDRQEKSSIENLFKQDDTIHSSHHLQIDKLKQSNKKYESKSITQRLNFKIKFRSKNTSHQSSVNVSKTNSVRQITSNCIFSPSTTINTNQTNMKEINDYLGDLDSFNKELKEYLEQVENKLLLNKQDLRLDKILKFYNRTLRDFKASRPPEELQIYKGPQEPVEYLTQIGDQVIHEELQKIMQNIYKTNAVHPYYQEEQQENQDEAFIEKKITLRKELIPSNQIQMRMLEQTNTPLFYHNIPRLIKEVNYNRYQLHSFYILYKVLHASTALKYRASGNYKLDEGIDFETFRQGIYQIIVQSEELAKGIFQIIDKNFSGFLNWPEFLKLMSCIQATTKQEKIDLFFKVADADGNGNLSLDEIQVLCRLSLKRFVTQTDEQFLDEISDFFARTIFNIIGYDVDDEIPFDVIKEKIQANDQDSNLLLMFCGADI